MKLKRTEIITSDVQDLIVLDRSLPLALRSKPFHKIEDDVEGTVLDRRLLDKAGAVPLIPRMPLYEVDRVGEYMWWVKDTLRVDPMEVQQLLPYAYQDLVFEVPKEGYVRVPKGVANSFKIPNGIAVLGDLQRAADRLLLLWEKKLDPTQRVDRSRYQEAFTQWERAIQRDLLYKFGWLDRQVGMVNPWSARAVAVADPSLKVDEVVPPRFWLDRLLESEEFRKETGINKIEDFEGVRIIVGRMPSHSKENIFSMKIKVLK